MPVHRWRGANGCERKPFAQDGFLPEQPQELLKLRPNFADMSRIFESYLLSRPVQNAHDSRILDPLL